MMVTLLITAFLNAFLIIGVYTACYYDEIAGEPIEESKMVLWKVRRFCLKHLGEFWSKPFCTCPPCMASVHSIIPYCLFVYVYGNYLALLAIPLYIATVSGITKLIHTKIETA